MTRRFSKLWTTENPRAARLGLGTGAVDVPLADFLSTVVFTDVRPNNPSMT